MHKGSDLLSRLWEGLKHKTISTQVHTSLHTFLRMLRNMHTEMHTFTDEYTRAQKHMHMHADATKGGQSGTKLCCV